MSCRKAKVSAGKEGAWRAYRGLGFYKGRQGTSSRETELISAARDSEKDVAKRLLAPWMLRVMICPFSSSFCSFRFRLS